MALIESVAEATARTDGVDAAMLACIECVCAWADWPVGHAYLARDGAVEPSALWHIDERFEPFRALTEATPLSTGDGLPGRVAASGKPLWITDVTRDPAFPRARAAAEVGLRGALCFPVPVGGRLFAVVECFSTAAVAPDDALLDVTAHVGRQLGRLIGGMQTAEALRESEARFRSLAESATDAIIVADGAGRIVSWNAGAEAMFGYAAGEVQGEPISLVIPERFRARHDAGVARVAGGGPSRVIGSTAELEGLRKDGSEFPLELSLATWETAEGRFFSGIIRDISERRRAEERLRALETAPDPIVEIGADGSIQAVNARTEQLFGYDRAELVGRPAAMLLREGATLTGGESHGRRRDGSEFPLEITLSTSDRILTAILRDVTERRRFERQLRHLADHDALTGLHNRRSFDAQLADVDGEAALLLLDLDRFKYVNDSRGHQAGDGVICAVADALRAGVRASDTVARLGGDEFAVLLRDADRRGALRTAEDLLERIRDLRLLVTASIGVACGRPVADDLLVQADVAMYAAKEAGGNRFQVAGDGGAQSLAGMRVRLDWAQRLRRALDEDRLVLFCQPIVELGSGEVHRHELLLRMREGDAVIAPGAFIDAAERFGLIGEIDRWVAREAIHLLAGDSALSVDVNVSGQSLGDPALRALVERELQATGIDPGRLVFEITETSAIANMRQAQEFTSELSRLGCRIALDDFGAGFSSFYYLKHLPLDYLKIDGEFVRGLQTNVTDQLVVKAMVDIARGIGIETVAEFVEDEPTAAALAATGVDYAQGYFFGRPAPLIPAAAAR